ncbi:MAG: protein-L-isoaspartate(D-aspartate) O-methyltransferase [Thermoguttaceae bacterium]|jgi:protein-L-isoaspartate(D-aspartate) O-methyltransferase
MSDADLQTAKINMLRRQLSGRGIADDRVLAAMGKVPRERFVPPESLFEAYADRALSIDCGQTISQPYMVALMTEAMELSGTERVLEIGTGSGYQTAILAELAAEVVSIERHALLSQQAAKILQELGYRNVRLFVGDGSLGRPDQAPYDRIMVTAMAAQCPRALFDQLREGGLIIIPIGGHEHQVLHAIRKVSGAAKTTLLTGCRFVPLIGEQGWSDG